MQAVYCSANLNNLSKTPSPDRQKSASVAAVEEKKPLRE